MPHTATTQQIQKNYRSLFDAVKEKKEPLVILNKNNPEVVILDLQTYEVLLKNSEKYEQEMAKKAVEVYEKEKSQKKLKKLNSLADLM